MNNFFRPEFFAGNRQALYKLLEPGSILVLTATTSMQQSLDQAYRFTQEPSFWHLTGIERADWLLVVDVDERCEWLLSPSVAEVHQIFDGSLSADDARAVSGIEQVISKRAGGKLLRELATAKRRIYTLLPQDLKFYDFYGNPAQRLLVRKLKSLGLPIEDARLLLSRQRAIKQPRELEALQQAVDVTVAGIRDVATRLSEFGAENEVEAALTTEFRLRKARHGFEPIVAAGQHTTTMHYEDNNADFQPGDWLLMDVGARAHHYNADISRTVPLGKPTDRQLKLYEMLRAAQQTIIGLMQPNADAKEYFETAEQVLHDSFARHGLLDKASERRAIYKVMPHMVSHGLGYDTHDPLGRPEKLLPGMVLTAEIGFYLWDEGFGVRLEDDIVIEASGPRNMSAALPTDLQELGVLG